MTNLTNLSVYQLKRAVAVRERIEELERELADILGESHSGAVTNGQGGRRKMSAAARAKIAAAQRARWARQKGSSGAAAPKTKGRRKMNAAARAKIAAAARARWAKVKAAGKSTLAG